MAFRGIVARSIEAAASLFTLPGVVKVTSGSQDPPLLTSSSLAGPLLIGACLASVSSLYFVAWPIIGIMTGFTWATPARAWFK